MNIEFNQQASCGLTRKPCVNADIAFKGRYKVEHFRSGEVVGVYEFDNGVTNEGKNAALETLFHSGTQFTAWRLGLIDNAGYTALAAADIYDNINQSGNGWDEFTSYTDAANGNSSSTRPTWTPGTASSQSITNSSPVVFDITGSGTIKGLFACAGTNAQTKGDHTAGSAHKLWGTALFNDGDKAVVSGDQLKVTYSVSC